MTCEFSNPPMCTRSVLYSPDASAAAVPRAVADALLVRLVVRRRGVGCHLRRPVTPVVGPGKSLSRVTLHDDRLHHWDVDVEATMRGLHEPGAYRDLASNPGTNDAVLRALADCQYPFVWHALAANPRTPADVLTRLCMQRDSTWNDNRLLLLIARHPHADRDVLLAVLGQLKALLSTCESRPYAAVLALATRAEITPEDVQALALLPGASARMRRGLRRRIAERREV